MVVKHIVGIVMKTGFYVERVAGEGICPKRLCTGAPLRLRKTLPDQCTGMDYTSLQPLHGALAPGVCRPDLAAHLLDDGQQFTVGGPLGHFDRLNKAHGGWAEVAERWPKAGR